MMMIISSNVMNYIIKIILFIEFRTIKVSRNRADSGLYKNIKYVIDSIIVSKNNVSEQQLQLIILEF